MSYRTFAEVSAVTEHEGGCFGAEISPDWTIGGKPNGGYLLAILGRAATAVSPHEHVLAASATYLRPPGPAPVVVRTEVLRAGRSASQVRALLVQDETGCVDAVFTIGTLAVDASPDWDAGLPPATAAPWENCVQMPATSPSGFDVSIMGQVELRVDPTDLGFAAGAPSGRGRLRGWLDLPGDAPFDPLALLYAVDSFPPASFEVAPSGWVPTLQLTAYVRALPAPGPVQVLQAAQLIGAGRVDEICYVWDGGGRLVAQATQLAGIRLT